MNDSLDTETKPNGCPLHSCSFNYCFWAKLMVAIPALPLAAIVASSYFESPEHKALATVATVILLIYSAIKIDQMTVFSRKIVKRNCTK